MKEQKALGEYSKMAHWKRYCKRLDEKTEKHVKKKREKIHRLLEGEITAEEQVFRECSRNVN